MIHASDLADMAFRNPKVTLDLFPSAFSGYILNEGKKDTIGIKSNHKIFYDWKYENVGNPEFQKLYQKAKNGQWMSEDLDWQINVDPANPETALIPEKLLPMYEQDFYQKLEPKMKDEIRHSTMAWMLSQFLHGEQGALYASAMTVEATPWLDAKYYGSTQVMDEARHVEVFHKYIAEKLEKLYQVNDNLYVIIHALTNAAEWDMKFLGMQIMIEGLALGAFGLIYKFTKEPLLREMLKKVISDEARHVHYGVEALRDYYTTEVSDSIRRDREDWAYEVAVLLRNRFFFLEVREEYFGHKMSQDRWIEMVLGSQVMEEFRKSLFSRLIPNLKAIGLLSDRIRPKYEKLGLLRYEGGAAADKITLNQLLAA